MENLAGHGSHPKKEWRKKLLRWRYSSMRDLKALIRHLSQFSSRSKSQWIIRQLISCSLARQRIKWRLPKLSFRLQILQMLQILCKVLSLQQRICLNSSMIEEQNLAPIARARLKTELYRSQQRLKLFHPLVEGTVARIAAWTRIWNHTWVIHDRFNRTTNELKSWGSTQRPHSTTKTSRTSWPLALTTHTETQVTWSITYQITWSWKNPNLKEKVKASIDCW